MGLGSWVDNPAPGALIAPDILAQAFQLQDLAVVNEEVYFIAVIFDVPLEDGAIGSLKHDVL